MHGGGRSAGHSYRVAITVFSSLAAIKVTVKAVGAVMTPETDGSDHSGQAKSPL